MTKPGAANMADSLAYDCPRVNCVDPPQDFDQSRSDCQTSRPDEQPATHLASEIADDEDPDDESGLGGSKAPSERETAHLPAIPFDTEREQLTAQYREIAQLAGGLAHEIRNPLSSMGLNLGLLAEMFEEAEDTRGRRAREVIARVRREGDRLQDILDDFLDFVRLQHMVTEPVDLLTILEGHADFLMPQAESQGVTIRTALANDLSPTPLSVNRFQQALLNLTLNALQAMPDGGDLFLVAKPDGPWNVIEVIDTGPGIATEQQSRIFEAFYSTKSKGSGLGLPMTRRIVEAHGGTITMQSELGKGTRFVIRLPVPGPPEQIVDARPPRQLTDESAPARLQKSSTSRPTGTTS